MSHSNTGNEADRIRSEYERRANQIDPDYYSLARAENLFVYTQRARDTLAALRKANLIPLRDRKILEIGCGKGDWLLDFEMWGARRENLFGIELDEPRAKLAQARLGDVLDQERRAEYPGAGIVIGDASKLLWPSNSFDIVLQATVFTSILDRSMQHAIAKEMMRVLKPGGIVLWYDFLFNNPRNPNVRKVTASEIKQLFPGHSISLSRITLAPPISRRTVQLSWIASAMLEKCKVLNTHYLAIIKKSVS